jgi:hypothetical protein
MKLMDNSQISSTQPVQPVMPTVTGVPTVQQAAVAPTNESKGGLVKTIVIIVLALVAITFIGLFIWIFMQYIEVREDIDGQISAAVAVAKEEQAVTLEAEFLEREKYPYNTFSGPADYGQLTFEYPRTWSVYVASDAANGGDFSAYFNPGQVNMVSSGTVNALRVEIRDKNFEDVSNEYQRYIDRKDSNLAIESITINGVSANLYGGKIPNTELNGYIVIFKIRDKTAVIQTDSVLFKGDFDRLLSTITFNA